MKQFFPLACRTTNLENKANRQKQLLAQALSSQEEFEMAQTDSAQAAADLENAVLAKEQLKNHALTTAIEKEEDIDAAGDQVKADEVALKNAQQKLKWTTVTAHHRRRRLRPARRQQFRPLSQWR